MKIAVVTGASSGMGNACVQQIKREARNLQEIWAIARNQKALKALEQTSGMPSIRCFSMNLAKTEEWQELQQVLESEKPDIRLLVHAAGMGTQESFQESAEKEMMETVDLNCTALTGLTRLCLPYCKKGSRFLFFSSAAAFLPQPGFAVYAATKAYVLSFSRALRQELKGRISVTTVCPGPVRTPFLEKMGGMENMPSYKKYFLAKPEKVVKKALQDSRKGKELSIYGLPMRGFFVLCKLTPHRALMKLAASQTTKKKGVQKK